MYFPGDYYRAKKAIANNGVNNGDIVGWEEGKNPSYTKDGENYRQDVAYNEDTGWVSVEIKDPPVDPDKPTIGEVTAETRDADFAQSNGSIFNISAEINHDLTIENWEGKIIDSNEQETYLKNPTLDNGKIKFDDVTDLRSSEYTIKINHTTESIATSEKKFVIKWKNAPVVDEDKSILPTITEGKGVKFNNNNLNIFVSGFNSPTYSNFIITSLDGEHIETMKATYSAGQEKFHPSEEIQLTAAQVDAGFNVTLFVKEGVDTFTSEIISHSGIMSGLGVGWIAGIATGSLVGITIIGIGIYWYVSKNKLNSKKTKSIYNKKTKDKIDVDNKEKALNYLESFSKGDKK